MKSTLITIIWVLALSSYSNAQFQCIEPTEGRDTSHRTLPNDNSKQFLTRVFLIKEDDIVEKLQNYKSRRSNESIDDIIKNNPEFLSDDKIVRLNNVRLRQTDYTGRKFQSDDNHYVYIDWIDPSTLDSADISHYNIETVGFQGITFVDSEQKTKYCYSYSGALDDANFDVFKVSTLKNAARGKKIENKIFDILVHYEEDGNGIRPNDYLSMLRFRKRIKPYESRLLGNTGFWFPINLLSVGSTEVNNQDRLTISAAPVSLAFGSRYYTRRGNYVGLSAITSLTLTTLSGDQGKTEVQGTLGVLADFNNKVLLGTRLISLSDIPDPDNFGDLFSFELVVGFNFF